MSLKVKPKLMLSVFAVLLSFVFSVIPAQAAQDPVEGGDGSPITWSITYKDGKDGSVFPDQSKLVEDGDKTPIYTPDAGVYPGYEFDGWEPELQQRVDSDMVYTAKWVVSKDAAAGDASAGVDDGDDPDVDDDLNTDIDSDTVSQDENEQAAKENAKKNNVEYEDDGSGDATDQGLVDDTGSGKENAYADDVDSGDMNMPVIGGLLVLCVVLISGMVFLLKRQRRD